MTVPKALRVRTLGSVAVEVGGRPMDVDTRKAIALLVYLAVTRRAHPRDALATLLWPESDEAKGRAVLRRTLSTLRSGLGDRWLRAEDEVSLDLSGAFVDVVEFETAVREKRLSDAVGLYAGDFMTGFSLRDSAAFDEWQSAEAERLRGEASRAFGDLVREEAAEGHAADALEHGRRWLALDELNEAAHREVMRLHARLGDRNAALRQYRECVRILDRELGVAPLPETVALSHTILAGDLEAAAPPERRDVAGTDEQLGDVYTLHGDYRHAIERYERGLADAKGDARGRLEHKLANVHHRLGEWDRAEERYERAARLAPGAWRGRVLADWSLAAHRAGDTARATRLARDAVAAARAAKDERALAQAHNVLGILARRRGERVAIEHLEESLRLAERANVPEVRVAARNNLALAYADSGQLDRAIALTESALEECRAVGDRHREAALENNLADVLRRARRTDESMRHLKRAVTLFASVGGRGTSEPEVWKLVEW